MQEQLGKRSKSVLTPAGRNPSYSWNWRFGIMRGKRSNIFGIKIDSEERFIMMIFRHQWRSTTDFRRLNSYVREINV